jgi:hypothetical protein
VSLCLHGNEDPPHPPVLTTHAVYRYRHVQNALHVDHTRTIHADHADSKNDRDAESQPDHQLATKFQRFSIKPLRDSRGVDVKTLRPKFEGYINMSDLAASANLRNRRSN